MSTSVPQTLTSVRKPIRKKRGKAFRLTAKPRKQRIQRLLIQPKESPGAPLIKETIVIDEEETESEAEIPVAEPKKEEEAPALPEIQNNVPASEPIIDELFHNMFDNEALIDVASFNNVSAPFDGIQFPAGEESIYTLFDAMQMTGNELLLPESRKDEVIEDSNWVFKDADTVGDAFLSLKRDFSAFSETSDMPSSSELGSPSFFSSSEDDQASLANLKPAFNASNDDDNEMKDTDYVPPPGTTDEESSSDSEEETIQRVKRCKISYAAAVATQKKLRSDALFSAPSVAELASARDRRLRSEAAGKMETVHSISYKDFPAIRIGTLNGVKYAHGADVAVVVESRCNIGRLFTTQEEFIQGKEITLARVAGPRHKGGQLGYVLTYAGVERFMRLKKVQKNEEYRCWIKERVLPLLL